MQRSQKLSSAVVARDSSSDEEGGLVDLSDAKFSQIVSFHDGS
jgi:hypothetical protein